MSWLYQLIYERIAEGGLAVPPPVLSRVFATLSEATNGFEHCRYAERSTALSYLVLARSICSVHDEGCGRIPAKGNVW